MSSFDTRCRWLPAAGCRGRSRTGAFWGAPIPRERPPPSLALNKPPVPRKRIFGLRSSLSGQWKVLAVWTCSFGIFPPSRSGLSREPPTAIACGPPGLHSVCSRDSLPVWQICGRRGERTNSSAAPRDSPIPGCFWGQGEISRWRMRARGQELISPGGPRSPAAAPGSH